MNSALISRLIRIPRSSCEVGRVCMSEWGREGGGWIQSSENEPNLKLRSSIIFPLFSDQEAKHAPFKTETSRNIGFGRDIHV